jgi:hypothetical protein
MNRMGPVERTKAFSAMGMFVVGNSATLDAISAPGPAQVMSLTALAAKFTAVMLTGWAADRGMDVCLAGVVNALIGIALNFVLCEVLAGYTATTTIAKAWVMQVCTAGDGKINLNGDVARTSLFPPHRGAR